MTTSTETSRPEPSATMSARPWGDLPCGVPGYQTTARGYAIMIRCYIEEGDFILAEVYMKAARAAGVLSAIENAAREMAEQGEGGFKIPPPAVDEDDHYVGRGH